MRYLHIKLITNSYPGQWVSSINPFCVAGDLSSEVDVGEGLGCILAKPISKNLFTVQIFLSFNSIIYLISQIHNSYE